MSDIPQSFQDALREIAGNNPFGLPVLRCVDGRSEQVWEAGGWCLKYTTLTEARTVFEYRDDEGQMQRVPREDEVPAGKIFLQREFQEEVGEDRLVVERWRSAEFLARTGRFAESARRDPEDGQVLLPELPAEGTYDFFMRLQHKDGSPCPPDEYALEMVRALWAYQNDYTAAERNRFHLEQTELDRKQAAAARRDVENERWGFDPDEYREVLGSDGHIKFEKKARMI